VAPVPSACPHSIQGARGPALPASGPEVAFACLCRLQIPHQTPPAPLNGATCHCTNMSVRLQASACRREPRSLHCVSRAMCRHRPGRTGVSINYSDNLAHRVTAHLKEANQTCCNKQQLPGSRLRSSPAANGNSNPFQSRHPSSSALRRMPRRARCRGVGRSNAGASAVYSARSRFLVLPERIDFRSASRSTCCCFI
jgi:hypothetical protein